MTKVVTECGLCGSDRLERVLSLGSSPPTCAMVPVGEQRPEVHYPLELLECADCSLVQLSVVPDRDEVFPADYPYSSGNSPQLHANFDDLASRLNLDATDLVVDVGANDGTLLSKFEGCRTIGVEPTHQARKVASPVYQTFFTERLARQIRAEHGPAKVVTACNVLAHVEDLDDVMRGIGLLLDGGGLLVTENHDLGCMVDGGQWDFVYHEHLRYFSSATFHALLKRHGFGWESCEQTATHGGSFRVSARKGRRDATVPSRRGYDFGALRRAAVEARRTLREVTAEPVWGIGATARAATVINYCGLAVEDVECVCEVPGSDKIGRYIPGTNIPVVSEDRLVAEQPDRALLFSWHLADVIVPKLRERGYQGDIIVADPALAAA